MQIIQDTKTRIASILENRETELKDIESKLAKAKESEQKASETMQAATNNSDVKAYSKAKATRNESRDAIEMYSNRLETLKSKELITKKEYEETVSEILENQSKSVKDAEKEINKLLEKLLTMGLNLSKEVSETNKVLTDWQTKIYRDADRTDKNGKVAYGNRKEFAYPDVARVILYGLCGHGEYYLKDRIDAYKKVMEYKNAERPIF